MEKHEGMSNEAQAAFEAGDVKSFLRALAGPNEKEIAEKRAAEEWQKDAEADYDIAKAVMETRGAAAGIRALIRLRGWNKKSE